MITTKFLKPKTILKNVLHILLYIVLGLLLAFFINNTVYAAEGDYNNYPPVIEDNGYTDPPPLDYDFVPPLEYPPTGWLLVTTVDHNTGQRLAGVIYEVRRALSDEWVTTVESDIFGEVSIKLLTGNYYFRQVSVPAGFIVDSSRVNFTINQDMTSDFTVRVLPVPNIPPPPIYGQLLVTSRAQDTGALLEGTVFEIRRVQDDSFVMQLVTNQFGEAFVNLPADNYYLRKILVRVGFIIDSSRVNFTINANSLTDITIRSFPAPPIPTYPPQNQTSPPPDIGRLLVTSRAHGTGDLLQGVIFEVRRLLDDVFVAQLATNQFGEASVNLPAGEFFIREISVPTGFVPNPHRIQIRITADRLTETNITHQPITPDTTQTTPENLPEGRLLITNRAQSLGTGGREQGTGQVLSNTIFEVRTIMDDRLIAQLQTNEHGEAAVNLPAGDYYIRMINPAAGHALDSARTNIRIVSGELFSILIISAPITPEAEPPVIDDSPIYGRLLLTLISSATGERLPHGTVTIHDVMTDAHIVTLISNYYGEASVFLPVGQYFIRQTAMPQGYLTTAERIPFTIRANEITDMSLAIRAVPTPTPAPTTTQAQTSSAAAATPTPTAAPPSNEGRIEIITRAAGSGNPLSGGTYAVFRASDHHRIGELTTAANGTAFIMVEPGFYYIRELRPTFGFLLETERIFLEVDRGETVTIELTKNRDFNIVYLPADVEGGGFIYITQTGQFMSMLHYMGGGFLLILSFVFGGLALWVFLSKKRQGVLNV